MEEIPTFGTPRENEERRDGGCAVVYDPETATFAVAVSDADSYLRLFGGGFDEGEDAQEGVLRELREESGLSNYEHVEKVGEAHAHYFNTIKKVNRVAHTTCFLVVLKDRATEPVALEDHENFTLDFVTKEELLANWRSRNVEGDVDHWIYYLEKAAKQLADLGYTGASEN